MVAKGMPQSLARVTLARKIASITLAIWKKGDGMNASLNRAVSSRGKLLE
jgi:hypothetical protein